MELKTYKEPPKLECPECKVNITVPSFRLRCFLVPGSHLCPCGKVRLRLVGNHWFGLAVGGSLLFIGGRLLNTALPFLVSFILLVAGAGVLGWGFFTSKLEVTERISKEKDLPATPLH